MTTATRSLKARAVGYLARREYSRAELGDKLRAGGASRDEVEPLLDELTTLGFLCDTRYAQGIVQQKAGAYSKRAIAGKLKAMGVAGETAAQALTDDAVDDNEAMVALWRRRFGRAPANEREKARQVRFLQSRGFALSAILKLVKDPPADV